MTETQIKQANEQWEIASSLALELGTDATANNGDKWAGEIEIKGSVVWFFYIGIDGMEYQSKEQPALRLDFSMAKTVWHKGNLCILLES